jgi:hypothetical protein
MRSNVYNDEEFERKERIAANQRIHRNKYYVGLVGFVADYMFYQREYNELLFKQVDRMWENVKEDDWLFKSFCLIWMLESMNLNILIKRDMKIMFR